MLLTFVTHLLRTAPGDLSYSSTLQFQSKQLHLSISHCTSFRVLTLQRFLLDRSYGPIINDVDSHRDISVACLGQLQQSLYLVKEPSDSSHLYRQTGQGFHALLPYAIEYWTEHLLDYFERIPEINSDQQSQVMKQLLDLCREHDQTSGALERGEVGHISHLKPAKEDHRLDCVKSFPEAFNLLNCFMYFRQVTDVAKGMYSFLLFQYPVR